jgi:ring-1,2-phenylacetyl-CoA epoxidase subunit PaaE
MLAGSRSIISNVIEARSARAYHPLTVKHVRRETRDALAVTFDVPPELRDVFRFTQGQFLTLRTIVDGEELRRSYSICSAPHDDELRVAIKRVADGRFSSWAHSALVPGAVIDVGPPDGRFHVPLAAGNVRHYLGVAAGSGITPLLSIIKTTLAVEPQSRFTLVYGNRSSSSVMFRDELQDLKDRYLERFALLFIMSREQGDIELFHGRIDEAKCDALFETWIDVATVDVAFVCGPEAMTEAVSASLASHGIAKDRLKTELFTAVPRGERTTAIRIEAGSAALCTASALIDGRRQTFTIEKGAETVLDAGLRQGLDLPYSCKGGVCSTCEVDMDVHYALEDYEIARGFILMCQSYPVSDTIAIDVDSHSHV